MNDERFQILKSTKLKNKRGRQWNDLDESLDESEQEIDSLEDYSESELSQSEPDLDEFDFDFETLTENAKRSNESSNKLAVLHYDFDRYQLSQLAAIIRSGLGKSGKIVSITKYPSEEYMDRCNKEQKNGPQELLESESASEEEIEKTRRENEIWRLKSFYAVFVFDSIDTANRVYRELDGVELEESGLRLDLRYVLKDKQIDIPDEFVHLVESLRPQSTKFTRIEFQKSGFGSTGCAENTDVGWDETPPITKDHLKRLSNCDLDDEEMWKEFKSTFPKKLFHCNDVNETRAKFGMPQLTEEEIQELQEENETDSDDEYEMDESMEMGDTGSELSEEELSEDNDDIETNDKKNKEAKSKSKKMSLQERKKLIMKEKSLKKTQKDKELLEYAVKSALTDDRWDDFFEDTEEFASENNLDVNQPHGENVLFLIEILKVRAKVLNLDWNNYIRYFPGYNVEEDDENPPRKKKKKNHK